MRQLLLTLIFAAHLISLAHVKADEVALRAQIERDLNDPKLSPKKRYILKILLGRELLTLGALAEATALYESIIKDVPATLSPAEALVNLSYLKARTGNLTEEEIRSFTKRLEAAKVAPELLREYRSLYRTKDIALKLEDLRGFYGQLKADVYMQEAIAAGDYSQALLALGPVDQTRDIVTKISYDLLLRLATQKRHPLLCETALKKYPSSVSYSMMLCRLLLKEKVTASDVKAFEVQLARETNSDENKKYLVTLAQVLKDE